MANEVSMKHPIAGQWSSTALSPALSAYTRQGARPSSALLSEDDIDEKIDAEKKKAFVGCLVCVGVGLIAGYIFWKRR